tara:strand:- start:3318 stop:5543 length:2226 start_codon:yes stop_codon:yes gene_type:complete
MFQLPSGFNHKNLAAAITATLLHATTSQIVLAEGGEGFVIEEVMVTATKRAASSQDIGVSITALSGDQVEDLGLASIKDVAAFTPGLSTVNSTSGGTPIFAIRGIGLDDWNINNSSGVGVYFDGAFAGNPALLGGQVMDIERVEVLKGPQGTLYGKNTTGGAINYISKKPTEEFDATVTIGYSKWDTAKVSGAIGGGVTDSMNGRLAYSYEKQNEGWQTDVRTGAEYGKTDKFALRGMLDFEISENVESLLSLRYATDKSLPPSPQGIDFYDSDAGGFSSLPSDPTAVDVGDLDVGRDEKGVGATFNLVADFNAFTLTSITAWDTFERKVVDNYNGYPISSYDIHQDGEVDMLSQEFRLTSNSDGNFSWIAGITYSAEEVVMQDFANAGANPSLALDPFFNASDLKQDTTSQGIYLHTETDLSDRMRLTGGLRYSQDKREFVGESTADFGFGLFQTASLDESKTEDDLSYKLGLEFDVTNDILLYSNVATGYKTGVYYGAPANDHRVWGYTEPEEVFSYEFGIKSQFFDNRLQINAAYFHYDYDDRQSALVVYQQAGPVLFDDPTDIFSVGLDNIDESEIDGAELEIRWLPMEGLDFSAGVGYLDSSIVSAKSEMRGISLLSDIPAGSVLSQAPEWSYNAIASYESDLSDTLYGRIQFAYSWTDDQVAALADPNAVYGPVKELDTRLIIGDLDDTWKVALWGKNITDEDSITYSYTNFLSGQTAYRQRPASYGVEVTFNFQ